jgi:hypothetical protein
MATERPSRERKKGRGPYASAMIATNQRGRELLAFDIGGVERCVEGGKDYTKKKPGGL